PAGDLAGGVEPGHRALLGVCVDFYTPHHVVAGRPDLHRLGGDVDVGELLELVVHRRDPAADELRIAPGCDVQEHASVRRPAAGFDLGDDRPGHLVAR